MKVNKAVLIFSSRSICALEIIAGSLPNNTMYNRNLGCRKPHTEVEPSDLVNSDYDYMAKHTVYTELKRRSRQR